MSLASRIKDRFRSRLARMVDKERKVAGCAKTAIANVGRKIGMSAVSVYRVLNGYGSVKIQAEHHAALIMHSVGIVKAAASRVGRKRQSALHA
jgi:hypothetical protein